MGSEAFENFVEILEQDRQFNDCCEAFTALWFQSRVPCGLPDLDERFDTDKARELLPQLTLACKRIKTCLKTINNRTFHVHDRITPDLQELTAPLPKNWRPPKFREEKKRRESDDIVEM